MRVFTFLFMAAVVFIVLMIRPVPDDSGPIDTTGKTSIIVEFDNGDWCELRGPGRFEALEHFGGCPARSDYDD